MSLAVEGDLLQTHSLGQLILVSGVSTPPEPEDRLAPLLNRYHVRLVRQRDAADFADEVRREAKEA